MPIAEQIRQLRHARPHRNMFEITDGGFAPDVRVMQNRLLSPSATSADLAAIITLAPSRAARRAMAGPMPREAPVIPRVLPRRIGAPITVRSSQFRDAGSAAASW